MRRRSTCAIVNEEADVPMSPLIDCVFLLLIFFLVTTVIKRKEKLIQIQMPDNTAAVKEQAADTTMTIAITADGKFLIPSGARDQWGVMKWQEISSLESHLDRLINRGGAKVLGEPVELAADRDLPFQEAIRAIDVCKNRGFERVSVKTMKPKK